MNVIYEIAMFLQQRFAEDRQRIDYLQRYGFQVGRYQEHVASMTNQVIMRSYSDLLAKEYLVKEALRYSPELEHGDNGEWALETMLKVFALSYIDHKDYQYIWQLPPGEPDVRRIRETVELLAKVELRTNDLDQLRSQPEQPHTSPDHASSEQPETPH